MIKNSFYFLILSILFIQDSNASLGNAMNKFWNDLGGSSNSNSAYMNQSIGYYTGGSINTRAPVIQQRPFNLQSPKITAGCGGIDMFTGSFSHINLDQFVAQMKAIGSNAVGYAFQIGLETLSPMIASTMGKLQEVVDQINAVNINSCESAKILVDGIATKKLALNEIGCAQMAMITGSASDADSAKTRCKSVSAQVQEDNKQPDSKKLININFTWQALKRDGYVESLGVETSEAFMSILGTIIYKENTDPTLVSGIIMNEKYSKALIDGGKIEIKSCEDDKIKCLVLKEKEIDITKDMAYKPRIKNLLTNMQKKILGSKKGEHNILEDSELALITQTSIPILRIMINTASGRSPIQVDMLAEIVAIDMLNKFSTSIVNSVSIALQSIKLENNNKDAIEILQSNLKDISQFLEKNKKDIKNEIEIINKLIDTNEKFEKQLASEFSGNIKSVLEFSTSLNNQYGGKK